MYSENALKVEAISLCVQTVKLSLYFALIEKITLGIPAGGVPAVVLFEKDKAVKAVSTVTV